MEDFFTGVELRRHAWPAGQADLHWLLVPTAAQARRLSGPYRELTAAAGLEPVLPEWLHITVLHSGPHSDATSGEVQQILDRVRTATADVPPLKLTFARPSIGTRAIERAARPGAPLRNLWRLTWEATREVVGDRWPLVPAKPYPHTTLAYAGAEAALADRGALKMMLSDIDDGEAAFEFGSLVFAAEWHDHATIRWNRIAEVPLGGTHDGGEEP